MKIFTAPQHTRFVLPPFHPTKFFACLAGRYFSFEELYLEFYISRLNEISPQRETERPRWGTPYFSCDIWIFQGAFAGHTLFLF
ncbi:hypothetical protein [Faecalibacterium prausnitzii]|uniref:hypothetical protein n=1 Tax=Faecalibacterium prausnitzii TaxID=853 RepID=UPI001CBC6C49|nr:hypothetical protein [Faecalibacterium prausnitzii]